MPFCTTKCGYCDFYSIPIVRELAPALVAAISHELSRHRPARPVETAFIGGGTPTVLPEAELRSLLQAVAAVAPSAEEFTVEANPSSADELKLGLLREHGVNRLSLGAQSFNPAELAVLGRRHDPRQISESVAAARALGFPNINLDLIYGIPGQTLPGWRATLRQAIELGPEHLSCYCLTYEPGTELTRRRDHGEVKACDETLEAEMFELTIDELSRSGYEHYEISNFARPGRRCRANLIYWENREYLGVGPSAVSYLDGIRRRNIADVRRYIDLVWTAPDDVVVDKERLEPPARACETAVQMLRLTSGIDVPVFRQSTGFDPHRLFARQIERFAGLGLMETTPQSIRLTRRGLLVANRVMEEMLPDE